MRSGGQDTLIRIMKPGPPVRDGRSRVDGPDVLVAELPCSYLPGQGTERFANAENAATAPAIFRCRREPEIEDVDAGCTILLLDLVDGVMVVRSRYDVKSARPAERDPRHTLEFMAVKKAGA